MGAQATQQDGAGFLSHVLELPESTNLRCNWQARLPPDAAQEEPVRDTGSGILYLPVPERAANLQCCIDQWHAQHDPAVCPHALVETPPVLFICLSRYRIGEDVALVDSAGTSRDSTAMSCPPYATCSLPVLRGSDLQVRLKQYRVVAGIMQGILSGVITTDLSWPRSQELAHLRIHPRICLRPVQFIATAGPFWGAGVVVY